MTGKKTSFSIATALAAAAAIVVLLLFRSVAVEAAYPFERASRFVRHRIVNTGEAGRILGCSRQNIDDLTRRGKLHPIRQDEKNKLFLRNEVIQRKQQYWL